MPGKILVVTEKPSVGRDIAKVLKCGQKGNGCLIGEKYIVTWAVGHLVMLLEPEDYDKRYKKWRMDTLPFIPGSMGLKAIPKTKDQLDIIKKLMNAPETDSIICATDSGREGELIFRYIYSIAKCKKPFSRLWISSMTDTAIKEGFENLSDGGAYENLYLSAKCRSESDWLVGINATRAFTTRYNTLLTIGRVQTPTLAIIAEKQKEINAFVPRDYFEVTALLSARGMDFQGKWFNPESNDTKIDSKEKADEIVNIAENGPASVKSSEREEKRQPPPLLYDLTELQRDCNVKFSFSAKKTLDIAQELYEKRKLITYPRTDSRYLSSDMTPKLPGIVKRLADVDNLKPFAERLMSLPNLPVTKRIADNSKVTDHHAIIPTETRADISALPHDLAVVYDLVARRFLAVFYPAYVYDSTKIVTDINGQNFVSKGTTPKEWGWRELYNHEKPAAVSGKKKSDDDAQNTPLPDVSVSESVEIKSVKSEKKKTLPPKPYNEATLLSAMENAGRFVDTTDDELKERLKESGLGTPATRAGIIERLIAVGYVERKGKTLTPTEKGMKLIEIVPPELKSPETTGKWEKGLSSISKGKMEPDKFMRSIERYVHYLVDHAKTCGNSEPWGAAPNPAGDFIPRPRL